MARHPEARGFGISHLSWAAYMPLVYTEYRGGVRHLVLNRPEKRNALNGELIGELAAAVEAAATDDEARVVVLRGEGPMFSSGMDLRDLRDLSEDPGSLRSFRRPVLACWNLLEAVSS
jgi:enoyl-CoA hydratase/carnithine racemase